MIKTSNGWKIDSDYQINLKKILTPTISGPNQVDSGNSGTWTTSVTNGVPPYSYTWYSKNSNTSWSQVGTGSSYSTTVFFSFDLKIEVTDANNNTGSAFQSVSSAEIPQPCAPCKSCPCPLSVQIDAVKKQLPKTYTLSKNYPNPFNPSTDIKYGVPEQAHVSLRIYNILGQKVATLINETKPAGYYTVHFDARNLASGLYIGRLAAKGKSGKKFVRDFKMQLIK